MSTSAGPLWEIWLIEGLAANHWAVICKVHHCLVDGVGGADLMTLLFDLSPDQTPAEPRPWTPQAEPSTLSLVLSGIRDTVGEPLRQAANVAALARRRTGSRPLGPAITAMIYTGPPRGLNAVTRTRHSLGA